MPPSFATSPHVRFRYKVIPDQAVARQLWPDQDAIGKRFSAKAASGPFLRCNWTSSNAAVTLIPFTTSTLGFPEGAESNASFLYRR
jgi:hypothetical protein